MSIYVIGDIQGCYDELISLTKLIDFNPSKDTIYLLGDMVNRGWQSLEVMKWVYIHADSVIPLLGNHDVYFLARYFGVIQSAKQDTNDCLHELIHAPECNKIVELLKARSSLIVNLDDYILSHAGVYPLFTLNQILEFNTKFYQQLNFGDPCDILSNIYGNWPNVYSDTLHDLIKLRFFVNTTTRMRFLNVNNHALDFKLKMHPEKLNNVDYKPWFSFNQTCSEIARKTVVFGHWSKIGLMNTNKYVCIDTGCVYGRQLTAFNLINKEIIAYDKQNSVHLK